MVYVTHDQTEAMTLGDRVAVMREGEIQQIGTPRELYSEPATLFVADFIGAPSMNFVSARVHQGRLMLPMAELPLPTQFERQELPANLVAGIRPEHVCEAASARDPTPPPSFEVEIELCEWLGTETIAYFEVEDPQSPAVLTGSNAQQWAARLSESSKAAEGKPLRLILNPEHLQLFDATSGKRIPS
jgi:multiple sugar transport system ATP-binding protein